MRKLFWGYAVCGVALASGVFAAGWYAGHHPGSPAGRALHGASRAAEHTNSISGFRTALANANRALAAEEPMPEEAATPPPLPMDPAPIVIRDDEPTITFSPPPADLSGAQVVECVPAACPAAPLTMPRCDEEASELLPPPATQKFELLPMPAVDIDVPPMPGVEEEQERSSGPANRRALFNFFMGFVRPAPPMPEAPEEIAVPECREDPNHHRHYPGCPASGSCMPTTPNTPRTEPQPDRPCFPDTPEPIEPKKDDSRHEVRKAIYKKLYQLINRTMPELGTPMRPTCDTMEYRPADGQLYEYGRGWL